VERDVVEIAVQINGKTRGTLTMDAGVSEDEVMEAIKKDAKLFGYLKDADIKRVIFVPDKIINCVIAQ
jgi:leucyl-tRNA synthetase